MTRTLGKDLRDGEIIGRLYSSPENNVVYRVNNLVPGREAGWQLFHAVSKYDALVLLTDDFSIHTVEWVNSMAYVLNGKRFNDERAPGSFKPQEPTREQREEKSNRPFVH